MKRSNRRRASAIAAILFSLWLSVCPVLAAPQYDEDMKDILEKSLSVVELDKEIARISAEQDKIAARLAESRKQLDEQEQAIDARRDEAGRVLRAYYTGDRNILLSALFSSDSLSDLLALLDYFRFIFASDRKKLDEYVKQYRSLQEGVAKLDRDAAGLAEVKARLNDQRERVGALQRDVDDALNGRTDADEVQTKIAEMTDYWDNVGLYEVKRYFRALSDAMKKMPEWVQSDKDMLAINGFTYTLTVPETKLNAFLREQNELFDNFSFAFENGKVIVEGKQEGLDVKLSGRYAIEDTKSGTGIVFHVDELVFNGLALPDTTGQELEKEFDLGFYPQKIIPFLKAKSVAIGQGNLTIELSVSF